MIESQKIDRDTDLIYLLAFLISNFAYLFKICQHRLWKIMLISFESYIIKFDEILVMEKDIVSIP